jgi:hypothetical protein
LARRFYTVSNILEIQTCPLIPKSQLHENYRRQSGSGLSLSFLVIWLVGDLFNLAGVILQKLMFTMVKE